MVKKEEGINSKTLLSNIEKSCIYLESQYHCNRNNQFPFYSAFTVPNSVIHKRNINLKLMWNSKSFGNWGELGFYGTQMSN